MGINVLSLFDGISCGQIALDRAGIEVNNYFASEVDKYAKQVTQLNYPNTKQIGSVTEVRSTDLPQIDLLMGGSPCQGFSYAGKRLNFNDSRSKLFFEFVRLVEETKPKYFLLENVKMKKEYQEIITKYLGVEPICINSNLVSAQNRERYFWTNIPNITKPTDRGIYLKDIIDDRAESPGLVIDGNNLLFIPVDRHSSINGLICLGGVTKPNHKTWESQQSFSQGNRVYSSAGKAVTLNASSGGLGGKTGLYEIGGVIRKLNRLECERLQTVPEGYTRAVSESQSLRLLGNGWTVDVIVHILKQMIDSN